MAPSRFENVIWQTLALCTEREYKILFFVHESNTLSSLIVQAFYHEKSVNLPLIAKEGFLTVFGSGTCLL